MGLLAYLHIPNNKHREQEVHLCGMWKTEILHFSFFLLLITSLAQI